MYFIVLGNQDTLRRIVSRPCTLCERCHSKAGYGRPNSLFTWFVRAASTAAAIFAKSIHCSFGTGIDTLANLGVYVALHVRRQVFDVHGHTQENSPLRSGQQGKKRGGYVNQYLMVHNYRVHGQRHQSGKSDSRTDGWDCQLRGR